MTPEQEAAHLREIAAALLLADEYATSLCRIASDETVDLLERIGRSWAADGDALMHSAHMLAPMDAPLPLFSWEKEEARA